MACKCSKNAMRVRRKQQDTLQYCPENRPPVLGMHFDGYFLGRELKGSKFPTDEDQYTIFKNIIYKNIMVQHC